jgi:hypothetical protein
MLKLRLLPFFLLLCFAPTVLAQTDCPTIINAALEAVDTACTGTERNQLCYGNVLLEVTPHGTTTQLQFEQPGDIANLADVQSLQLSSFSLDDSTWGVALMNVQANLPDTLPGQNVTFLLFGDVSITNASNGMGELSVMAISGVNVRQRPTTNATVVGSLSSGQEVIATGRLSDSSWIRVRPNDETEGWVSADFVSGDLNMLLVTDADAPAFGPMQAFYFTTGINDAPCAEAPDSGILIQTPQGAGEISLRLNYVDIQLGSTVYLQAVPGDVMRVTVIEGHATLTADGESQVVPARTVSAVPLDSSGVASGAPEFPTPVDDNALEALPLDTLPEVVEVAPPVLDSNIAAQIDIANGLPPNGQWIHTEIATHLGCPPFVAPGATVGLRSDMQTIITFSEDRTTFELPIPLPVIMYRQRGGNTYVGHFSVATWEATFTSPTTYIGTFYNGPIGADCTFVAAVEGVYQPIEE